MDFPYELIIRDIPRTEGFEQRIEEKVEKLGTFCDRISHCRVIVDAPRQSGKAAAFRVSIELGVPGTEIVANRVGQTSTSHESLTATVRDAFGAARRQLQDYVGKKRDHSTKEEKLD